MKKLLVILISLLAVSACSSNEANVKPVDRTPVKTDDQAVAAIIADLKYTAEKNAAKRKTSKDKGSKKEAKKKQSRPGKKIMGSSTAGLSNRKAVCNNGKYDRIIRVIYKKKTSGVSCEVTYEKISGTKTLWTADSDMAYCLDKANMFVKKQVGWGWRCSELN